MWRLEDPILGDLKIPQFNEPIKGKIAISQDTTFKVDVDKREVSVLSDGQCYAIGRSITYLL